MRQEIGLGLLIILGLTGCAATSPRWMVCAVDQQYTMTDGINRIVDAPKTGALVIMDVSGNPLRSVGILENVPCSMVGPPTCVAVAPDQKTALVAGARKLDPDNPKKQVPDNRLSVIRLQPGAHKVIQTLTLGVQPSGVDISPDGRRALIVNRGDGSVSLLALDENGPVRLLGTFPVADAGSDVSHVAFSPDGRQALVSLYKKGSVMLLSLAGDQVRVADEVATDRGPYSIKFLPGGQYAMVAHTLGGTLKMLRVENESLRVVDTLPVGLMPEGLDISPDGNWLVASCLDNSYWKPKKLGRRAGGMLVLLQKQNGVFVTMDVARTGRNPQAVSFTPDSRFVAVGCNGDHEIAFFKLENDRLKPTEIRVPCPGGPAALRIAN